MKNSMDRKMSYFNPEIRDELIQVSKGNIEADVVVKNGNLVNVYTQEIYPEDIAIKGDYIASFGPVDRSIGPSTLVIDAKSEYVMPGFIETHMHVAGSHLSMSELARVLLAHGTTSISTDFFHIGIVSGIKGIRFCLDELHKTPLKVLFVLPTAAYFQNVELGFPATPTAPTISDLEWMLDWEDCVGVGETLLDVVRTDDQMKSLFTKALEANKVITGTSTGVRDIDDLNEWILFGCSSDHEMKTAKFATQLARHGAYIHIREGSAASDLKSVVPAITDGQIDSSRFIFCTDEEDPYRLMTCGNIDYKINDLIELGVDAVQAIQIATLNAACYFKKSDSIGGLSPGKIADIVISKSIDKVIVDKVLANGKLVVVDGQCTLAEEKIEYPSFLRDSIKLNTSTTRKDFELTSTKNQQGVHLIKVTEGSLISELDVVSLPVDQGTIQTDIPRDILGIAMVDRYSETKKIGNAFVNGFGLKFGALACSFSPMTENIMVVGADSRSMSFAVNVLCDNGGGLVAVNNDQILSLLRLPLLGLLSDEKLEIVIKRLQDLLKTTKNMGCQLRSPFTTLGFVGITKLGNIKLSPAGLFEPGTKKFVAALSD